MRILSLLFTLLMVSCASQERTIWTDPVMRLAILPDGINAGDYARIEAALVSSGKWVVIERSEAFERIKREQEMEQRTESDRFDDEEKFALYGRLLGVGGVVVAHSQCAHKKAVFFGPGYTHCQQYLAIVNTVTGEVIAAIEGKADDAEELHGSIKVAASWNESVEKLNAAFPKNFKPAKWSERMKDYKREVKEEAMRQKAIAGDVR